MLSNMLKKKVHTIRCLLLIVITWIGFFCSCPPSFALTAEKETLLENDNIGKIRFFEAGGIVPDQGQITIGIDVSNVDEFLPAPDFDFLVPGLRRSIDPFGAGMDWFQSSRIQTGRGGIRIFDVILNNVPYWMDMRINPNSPVTLDIVDMQPDFPSTDFPHWGFGHDVIDFRLANADIFGPPPYFSIFDVGVGESLYNLDFTLTGSAFVLSGVTPAGYVNYFPKNASPQLAVITDTPAAPVMTDTASICFSDLPVGTPMALFNVPGPDGEDYLNVNYCGRTVTQKFSIYDGIALATYGPPQNAARTRSLDTEEGLVSLQFLGMFSRPSREEKLTQCIKDQTTLTIGLQRDNQLGKAITDLATSFVGELNSKYKVTVGNTSLNSTITAALDSKDVMADLMATGKLDPAKMSEFVLKTLLKNATPKEHEAMVKAFFDGDVPDHVKTLAEGSGTAMEAQYKTALLGIIKGGVKTFFPKSSAVAETVIEGQKWAIEAMADEDIRILYRRFKEFDGHWEDFNDTWNVSRYRANKQIKIKQLLEKQKPGESITDAEVKAYTKKLFEGWYSQEKEYPAKLKELEEIKKKYNDSFSWTLREGLERLMPNATECDRLLKYQELVNQAYLDILESMGKCKGRPPTKDAIRDNAFMMVRDGVGGAGTPDDRRAAYQKTKLDFLQIHDCLNLKSDTTEEIAVPDVVGMMQSDAEKTIEQINLVATVTTAYHVTVPEGQIVSQNPAAGTGVEPGSTVNVVVSSGKKDKGGYYHLVETIANPGGNDYEKQRTARIKIEVSATWSEGSVSSTANYFFDGKPDGQFIASLTWAPPPQKIYPDVETPLNFAVTGTATVDSGSRGAHGGAIWRDNNFVCGVNVHTGAAGTRVSECENPLTVRGSAAPKQSFELIYSISITHMSTSGQGKYTYVYQWVP